MRGLKYSLLIPVLFLLIVSLVQAISYDDKNTLNTIVSVSNDFTVVPTASSYNIKFINASIDAFPKNDVRQFVTDLTTTPKADVGDEIYFLFNDPTQTDYNIRVDSKVMTNNVFDEMTAPISFPLTDLDSSLYPYLKPTDIIDVTPEIKNLASELIGDKKDLYDIEYTLAEYVRKNVAYDLSSLTTDVNQKSSWVLENKIGVCDEITNLFISLNRAAGIPTRFVSGVAYTNLDEVFGKSWVPHAWAEVYYPGVGWIPYDVTYGEYGFIDAGHIKLDDSIESSGSDVNYNYLGYNVKLNPGAINIDVNVTGYGDDVHGRYDFVAKVYNDMAGFGSYDMIRVDIKNTKNYYQVADLYLAETQGMSIIEESKETVLNKTIHRKEVLLKPYQNSTIYWIIQLDKNLDPKYVYTLPLTVYNTYNDTGVTFLTARNDYSVVDYNYFTSMISSMAEESVKAYSKNILLDCQSSKDSMYIEDTLNINCTLDNIGDKSFDSINICIDDNCTARSLAIQKVPLAFSKSFDTTGLKNVEIKVYNDEFTKVSYIPINVLDKPKISITELTAPDTVDYKDPFDISFTLTKDSKSTPKNLKILLQSETNKVEWSFPEFDSDKGFTLASKGSTMRPNTNHYAITVFYTDDKGNVYSTEKDFNVNSQATFFENIFLYLNLIGRSIEHAVGG